MNLIILALAVIVVYVGVRWFLSRAPQRGKRFLLQLLLVILALLALWLALTGRLHWLFALFSSLLPFARRLLPLLIPLLRWLPWLKQQRQRSRNSQPRSGQSSTTRTRWLDMTLDHDSGTISGEVIDGPFKGQQIDQLSDQQLLELYQQCARYDQPALKLLDAYIDRHRPGFAAEQQGEGYQGHSDRRRSEQDDKSSGSEPMSQQEAYQILGLEPGASEEEIIQAHKRMMQKNHPDRGGSNYLAAKINQAKQRLLG